MATKDTDDNGACMLHTAHARRSSSGSPPIGGGGGVPRLPMLWLCRFASRARTQLPHADAHDLTLLALGFAVLGPPLSRHWLRAFGDAVTRQNTSLELQVQVGVKKQGWEMHLDAVARQTTSLGPQSAG